MNEYTHFLNADNFYLCSMTDLKRTTFKKLIDDKRTLLNRYLSLLVDDGKKFLESITILEKALFYTNELTEVYLQSQFLETSHFYFFNMSRKSTHLGLELVSEIGIYISINRQYIQFNFGKKSNPCEYFKWNRTFNMDNDIVMIRNLFIVYFEKLR